jgi:hypothetical protein
MDDTNNKIHQSDEQHGFPLNRHFDEAGATRGDLFRASLAQFSKLSAISPALWEQIGPAPATVNQYLAGNGQMPGPNTGAVLDMAIDPSGTTDQIIYAVSNDGVWKTTDGGSTWLPITDELDTLSFGAVALDPSSPSTVYAGTGSIFNNGYFKGIGVYKSADGGATWTLMPGSSVLNGIGINKLLVPSPGALLVASQQGMWLCSDGKTFYEITMGGVTGQYITDLDMNPGATSPIWACVEGQGIFVSTDQGNTFPTNLWTSSNGAPTSYSFVSLGVSSDGNTMYANIASSAGLGVFKSIDAGQEWTNITASAFNSANATRDGNTIPIWRQITNQPGYGPQLTYDQTLGVDPQNPDWVYMGFQDLWLSQDGGSTWTDVTYNSAYTTELMHVDHHALVFSPPSHWRSAAPTSLWVGNDGGIWTSANAGGAWTNCNATRGTNLFRCIDTGRGINNNAYTYGGMQDTGTAAGNSVSGSAWAEWGGGDGGAVAADPTNGQRAYGLWGAPIYTADGGATFHWGTVSQSLPGYTDLAVDASGNVYLAGQTTLYLSTDHGENFAPFFTASQNISSIALSLANTSIVWLSLSDGSVTVATINQGTPTGQNYTIPGAIQGQVPSLAVDQTNANRVVAVFAGYSQQSLPSPSRHVFLTSDGGANWQDISGGHAGQCVPDMPLYAAAIDSNTAPPSISVASDLGVMHSINLGNSWHQLGTDLPNVHTVALAIDTTVNPSLLKIGTYGRSTWQITLPQTMITPLSANILQTANISWTNSSTETVYLSWVDGNGTESQIGVLAAGASTTEGPVYFGGVSLIRDGNGNVVLVHIVNGDDNPSVVISQEGLQAAKSAGLKILSSLRSLTGGVGVPDFSVQNNSSAALNVNWIDTNGIPNPIGSLAPGNGMTIGPTYFGGMFTLNNANGIVTVFVASAAQSQTFVANDAMIAFWQ